MEQINETNFREILEKALNIYYPNWATHGKPQNSENSPPHVAIKTLLSWIRGNRFPQPKKFRAFVAESKFPTQIQSELLHLYNTIALNRKQVESSNPITHYTVSKIDRRKLAYALPNRTASFVERPKDFEKVARLLKDDQCRLITLTGFSGIGKTSLAVKIALEFIDDSNSFPDGIYFIPLAYVESPKFLFSKIAQVLDLKPLVESDQRTRDDQGDAKHSVGCA